MRLEPLAGYFVWISHVTGTQLRQPLPAALPACGLAGAGVGSRARTRSEALCYGIWASQAAAALLYQSPSPVLPFSCLGGADIMPYKLLLLGIKRCFHELLYSSHYFLMLSSHKHPATHIFVFYGEWHPYRKSWWIFIITVCGNSQDWARETEIFIFGSLMAYGRNCLGNGFVDLDMHEASVNHSFINCKISILKQLSAKRHSRSYQERRKKMFVTGLLSWKLLSWLMFLKGK